jgi:hypothetical protein
MIPKFKAEYFQNKFIREGTRPPLNNPAWLRDVEQSLTEWIERGGSSFVWDLWGPSSELVEVIARVRELARTDNPQSTFAGECLSPGALERDSEIIDYTWNWGDEVKYDPILSVFKAPRLNCNAEVPMLVKMAFMCGQYVNVYPRKPDQVNGTSLIGDIPQLSHAVKVCAGLRKQFLPYFTEGWLIGDSVLSEPATGFIRGHVHNGKLLVFVLNDSERAKRLTVPCDLRLWLPPADDYEVKVFNESGEQVDVSLPQGTDWRRTTGLLQTGELAVYEISGCLSK